RGIHAPVQKRPRLQPAGHHARRCRSARVSPQVSVMARRHDDPDDADLARLEEAEREIERRIAEVESLPERLRREAEERATTLPPPDDLIDRKRRRDFEEKV